MSSDEMIRVTAVLDSLYPFPRNDGSEFYMARGSYIHRACELAAEDNLNFDELPDDQHVRGCVSAYMKYLEDYGLKWKTCIREERNFHHGYGYRYKPDAYYPEHQIMEDIKAGPGAGPRYAMQLIAYAQGHEWNKNPVKERRIVELKADGEYDVRIIPDDKNVFRAFISQLRFLQKQLKTEE